MRSYGTPPRIWDGDPLCLHDWSATAPRRSRTEDDCPNSPKQSTSSGTLYDAQGGSVCEFCGAWRGELGLEPTPELYVQHIVQVFRDVRRVLHDTGTAWCNLGDSYAGSWGNYGGQNRGGGSQRSIITGSRVPNPAYDGLERWKPPQAAVAGLKPKDLCGIPWRVAFALQADGWYLRSDIVWAKPNPMPESVTDRPTRSHEYIFLLSKRERYFYDSEAIREPSEMKPQNRFTTGRGEKDCGYADHRKAPGMTEPNGRNKRDVWFIASEANPVAHFATFPTALVEPCILAGSRAGDLVLDPFLGSGTTGRVAERFGRRWIGLDLSADYVGLADNETAQMGLRL